MIICTAGQLQYNKRKQWNSWMSSQCVDGRWTVTSPTVCLDGKNSHQKWALLAPVLKIIWAFFLSQKSSCKSISRWNMANNFSRIPVTSMTKSEDVPTSQTPSYEWSWAWQKLIWTSWEVFPVIYWTSKWSLPVCVHSTDYLGSLCRDILE